MSEKSKSGTKIIAYIVFVIAVNIAVIMTAICCCNNSTSKNETKRFNDKVAAGSVENAEDVCGMVFDYKILIGMNNGETREFNGSENYYWNGKEFIPVTDFMKGYE